jgi:hypothetical protein
MCDVLANPVDVPAIHTHTGSGARATSLLEVGFRLN